MYDFILKYFFKKNAGKEITLDTLERPKLLLRTITI